MSTKNPRLPEDIALKIAERTIYESPKECWSWTGHIGGRGYAQIKIDGKWEYTHRILWRLHNGDIPDDPSYLGHSMEIHLRCNNRWCVNPEHFFMISRGERSIHMYLRGIRLAQKRRGQFKCLRELSENDFIAIAAIQGGTGRWNDPLNEQLAKKYKLSPWQIYAIRRLARSVVIVEEAKPEEPYDI